MEDQLEYHGEMEWVFSPLQRHIALETVRPWRERDTIEEMRRLQACHICEDLMFKLGRCNHAV